MKKVLPDRRENKKRNNSKSCVCKCKCHHSSKHEKRQSLRQMIEDNGDAAGVIF